MNIIVQCGGGLCNRINNLVNGIYMSQILERNLYVWWDLNNACHCPIEKLFSNDFRLNYKDIWTDDFTYYSPFNNDGKKNKEKNIYGQTKHRLTWRYDDYSLTHLRADGQLNEKYQDIISELKGIQSPTLVFSSSLIATEIIPEECVRKILSELMPITELMEQIEENSNAFGIDQSVVGIHLRKTDYNLLDDGHVLSSINERLKVDGEKKFLICSDSYDSETKFKTLYPNNVILISGKTYLDKINGKKTDTEFSNLMRTEKSVQHALVDMYLLAKTSFEIFSPISTFAQTAFRLSKTQNK